jgi:hypothetical protein
MSQCKTTVIDIDCLIAGLMRNAAREAVIGQEEVARR